MSFLTGKAPQIQYTPKGFSSGGLSASYGPGGYNLGETPAMASNVAQLGQTFGRQAGELGTLKGQVAPGFSQFRQAGMAALENRRMGAISNLRDTLAQRRILGSSFGNASVSQAEAEFAQQEAQFQADAYLKEIQATAELTNQQYQAATQQFATAINQSNFEAGIAANLTNSANQAAASVATAQAKLDAEAQAGAGKLVGTVVGATIGGLAGGPAGALTGAKIGSMA